MGDKKRTSQLITEIPFGLRQWFKIYAIRNNTSMKAVIWEFLEDLRRKDFIAVRNLSQKEVCAPTFARDLEALFRTGAPLMRFLCDSVDVPF